MPMPMPKPAPAPPAAGPSVPPVEATPPPPVGSDDSSAQPVATLEDLAEKYGLSPEEAHEFVNDLVTLIQSMQSEETPAGGEEVV